VIACLAGGTDSTVALENHFRPTLSVAVPCCDAEIRGVEQIIIDTTDDHTDYVVIDTAASRVGSF
jgi:hypothetical protein